MLVPIPGSNGSYEYDPSIPAPSGGGGGGGGGDFSTAKVTFINSDDTKVYSVNKLVMIQGSYMEAGSVSVNSSEAVDLVLYKGSTYVSEFEDIDYDTPPVVTGNISFDAYAGEFVITGEGSITLKGVGGIL